MAREPERSENHADVFDCFGVKPADRPAVSCYLYAPVFPVVIDGQSAVIKRTRGPFGDARGLATWLGELSAGKVPVVAPLPVAKENPVQIGKRVWVAYPWVQGSAYQGTAEEIAAAGDLLGRLHAAPVTGRDMPHFAWPDHDQASVDEDIEGLDRVFGRHAPDVRERELPRFTAWLNDFMTQTLPAVKAADLPTVPASMDFKASNLVYTPDGPVLIDPDNGEVAARLLDLALAVLLFHNEADAAPARLFTTPEWTVFRDAYTRHVELTPQEIRVWPAALRYMLLEWCVWSLIDADEWDDWTDPRKRSFLIDLATLELDRFPL
ncbi:phosphotransferase [Streptomyces sp. NPDC058045]|uniref:phosphotransferase n=1 Tax=Streptomyces sp. NPDC058045 TaxID=3346311 RepID=UPI0036E430D2